MRGRYFQLMLGRKVSLGGMVQDFKGAYEAQDSVGLQTLAGHLQRPRA